VSRNRSCRLKKSRGFSLVEIVIALGLFAFCVVAITGLFSVGLGATRSVANDAVASSITESIYSAWQMQRDAAAPLRLVPMFEEDLPALTGGELEIYLNDSGRQVSDALEAALLLRYRPQPAGPQTYRLELRYQWPATAATNAATGIQTRSFSRTFFKP
jgi:uncharacterized protein (TIGR02598 family)